MKDLLTPKINYRFWSKNTPRGDTLGLWQLADGTIVGFVADAPTMTAPDTSQLLLTAVTEICRDAAASLEPWKGTMLARTIINNASSMLYQANASRPGQAPAEAVGCVMVIRHGVIAVAGVGDCSVVLVGPKRTVRITDPSGEQALPLHRHHLKEFGFEPTTRLGCFDRIYPETGKPAPVTFKTDDFYRAMLFTDGLDFHAPNFEHDVEVSDTTTDLVDRLAANVPSSLQAGLMDDVTFVVLSFDDLDELGRHHLSSPQTLSLLAAPEPIGLAAPPAEDSGFVSKLVQGAQSLPAVAKKLSGTLASPLATLPRASSHREIAVEPPDTMAALSARVTSLHRRVWVLTLLTSVLIVLLLFVGMLATWIYFDWSRDSVMSRLIFPPPESNRWIPATSEHQLPQVVEAPFVPPSQEPIGEQPMIPEPTHETTAGQATNSLPMNEHAAVKKGEKQDKQLPKKK